MRVEVTWNEEQERLEFYYKEADRATYLTRQMLETPQYLSQFMKKFLEVISGERKID